MFCALATIGHSRSIRVGRVQWAKQLSLPDIVGNCLGREGNYHSRILPRFYSVWSHSMSACACHGDWWPLKRSRGVKLSDTLITKQRRATHQRLLPVFRYGAVVHIDFKGARLPHSVPLFTAHCPRDRAFAGSVKRLLLLASTQSRQTMSLNYWRSKRPLNPQNPVIGTK
jgi:hypothetical protein